QLDSTELVWKNAGRYDVISLTEEQWNLVQKLELNVFVDDGEGFIDLGLDNYYEFNSYGLVNAYDGSWLAIGDQFVAYYYEKTDGNTISGRIPVLLNGERAELLVEFVGNAPGAVRGARRVYVNGETETVAKPWAELEAGDVIIPIADYYTYQKQYVDSFEIGDPIVYDGTALTVSDRILVDDYVATYLFTDIYNQEHWSEKLP
ncbi:MAG: peptidase C11, partial [Clostridia bacterium]|nr:peptidase C11 [Clostridia bacterium]